LPAAGSFSAAAGSFCAPARSFSAATRSFRAAAFVLVLAAGCATRAELGVEGGRPAVFLPAAREAAPSAVVAEGGESSGELEARVRRAEAAGGAGDALVDALYDLARAQRRQGQLDEAARSYRRALEICERTRGSHHPDVATILNNLAVVEAARGDYDAAQPLLERALTVRRVAFGEADPLTARSMNNLALLYAAQGKADAAEPLYRSALAILERAARGSKSDLRQVLENYAALLRETGRDPEAAELEVRARLIRSTSLAREPALLP
jgi:tetratricopeptide (TPR) repeat protein